MTHIELSLSPLDTAVVIDPLERWSVAVAGAAESCLVIDATEVIRASSVSCARLFGLRHPGELIGRSMLEPNLLRLIDFTAFGNDLGGSERDQIAPLLALTSGQLTRGLMRVRTSVDSSSTVDAIAAPLWDGGRVIGSLSFFSSV